MGQIVGAFAMSHQLGSPEGVEDQSERVFQGMREVGRRIRALDPDLIVMITSDHLNNFSLASPAPFAVGTAAEFTPCGDMGLPRDPFPGHPAFAEDLIGFARGEDLGIARADPLQPDHGAMIPLGIVDPDRTIPAVPLYVNTVFYPHPTPAESYRLGGVLRDFVGAGRPQGEKVVLLAGGGLSHWVGMPQEGVINETWDRAFLGDVLAGRGQALAGLDNSEILEVAGNGGLEVAAWIALAGAVPGAKGEEIFYEPMPSWATGMAGIELEVA
ncbi:protocatechuate 3,4-dioxygenase [Pacificimonas flava]|uniref:Protocatechuate 3,4-dioxygenase n=2 Tax=Pacificimonas TaxID=1960290 RepID=A0A219B5R2_9SPHN|nr:MULTISPECIES: protocatechuate 3,4-dioxygenase [Pacificimonas]MBZ6377159.1 hypothetical protein [Pacificimonas aurantium]OWV33118.1 protocatechuate 3,4-dioxygenase [Pacificimonas flava]